jgi:hypothetical protein
VTISDVDRHREEPKGDVAISARPKKLSVRHGIAASRYRGSSR